MLLILKLKTVISLTCESRTSRASPCKEATRNTRLRRFGAPKPAEEVVLTSFQPSRADSDVPEASSIEQMSILAKCPPEYLPKVRKECGVHVTLMFQDMTFIELLMS